MSIHPSTAGGAERADVILVGGGLANSLLALRLRVRQPRRRVLMLERAATPNESQTWSFFDSDVPPAVASWLHPLCERRWPGYRVSFPEADRELATPYNSTTATRLGPALAAVMNGGLRRGVEAISVTGGRVEAADGRAFEAPLVIDGRGARASGHLQLAWQKFVGLEIRTAAPHGLDLPIVMDAAVRQRDGFRFLYVLPLAPDRLLVEDTRYSDGASLDQAAVEESALEYAAQNSWRPVDILRREHGVLPIALGGDIDAFWNERDPDVPCVGMNAALFHPTTGYSLPDAACLADEIASSCEFTSAAVAARVRERSKGLWRERRYFHALNRMMFRAAAPDQRWRVLARFYRLPEPLIRRFYAGKLTMGDQARILLGEPPVPIWRALAALRNGGAAPRPHAA